MLYQKQISRIGTSNYILHILSDEITCPCLWYLHLAKYYSNNERVNTYVIDSNESDRWMYMICYSQMNIVHRRDMKMYPWIRWSQLRRCYLKTGVAKIFNIKIINDDHISILTNRLMLTRKVILMHLLSTMSPGPVTLGGKDRDPPSSRQVYPVFLNLYNLQTRTVNPTRYAYVFWRCCCCCCCYAFVLCFGYDIGTWRIPMLHLPRLFQNDSLALLQSISPQIRVST